MKVIIAGGRNYRVTERDVQWLDDMHKQHHFSEVVCGGAKGADTAGEEWAKSRGIPVKMFPAQWHDLDAPGAKVKERPDGSKYNRLAGFHRNEQMAQYADALIAFPGGSGTAHMTRMGQQYGLRMFGRIR